MPESPTNEVVLVSYSRCRRSALLFSSTRVENDVPTETRDAEDARNTKGINLCSGARKVR